MTPWEIAGKSESSQQKALFAWAAMAQRVGFDNAWAENSYVGELAFEPMPIPELAWLFHIPNGSNRDAVTAGRLKAEGVKKGVWDIFLAAKAQKLVWLMGRNEGWN